MLKIIIPTNYMLTSNMFSFKSSGDGRDDMNVSKLILLPPFDPFFFSSKASKLTGWSWHGFVIKLCGDSKKADDAAPPANMNKLNEYIYTMFGVCWQLLAGD